MLSAVRIGKMLCALLLVGCGTFLGGVSFEGFAFASAEAERTRRGEAVIMDFKGPGAEASAKAAYAREAGETWRSHAVVPVLELAAALIAVLGGGALLVGTVRAAPEG